MVTALFISTEALVSSVMEKDEVVLPSLLKVVENLQCNNSTFDLAISKLLGELLAKKKKLSLTITRAIKTRVLKNHFQTPLKLEECSEAAKVSCPLTQGALLSGRCGTSDSGGITETNVHRSTLFPRTCLIEHF